MLVKKIPVHLLRQISFNFFLFFLFFDPMKTGWSNRFLLVHILPDFKKGFWEFIFKLVGFQPLLTLGSWVHDIALCWRFAIHWIFDTDHLWFFLSISYDYVFMLLHMLYTIIATIETFLDRFLIFLILKCW